MKFRERLAAMDKFTCDASKPTESQMMQLCHPQVIRCEGEPVGIVRTGAAALLVGAVGSHRLTHAVLDVLDELHAAIIKPGSNAEMSARVGLVLAELIEARQVLDEHTRSCSAAMDAELVEHEALHAAEVAERGSLN